MPEIPHPTHPDQQDPQRQQEKQEHVDIDDAVAGAAAAMTDERARLLEELGLQLPTAWNSPEFAQGLQEIRKQQFKPGERVLFNHMVCEELARRGEPPNSRNVLMCGGWGSSVKVASDVRAWYAGLASKLASRQAKIPDGARRQANELLELLWSIAYQNAREPLEVEILRLRNELLTCQEESAESKTLIAQLHTANERAVTQARAIDNELTAATGALVQLREQSAAQIVELNRSIANRALEHSNELRSQQEKHAAAQEASAAAHAQVVSDLNARIHTLEQDSHDVRREAAAEVDRARQATIEATRQAEQARSDARDAAHRFEKALAAAEERASAALAQERTAKERQSQAEAAAQRTAGERDQALQEIARLGQLLKEVQDALAKSKSQIAPGADRRSRQEEPGAKRKK